MRTLFLPPQTSKQALLYPVTGWLTGGLAAALFWSGQFLFPNDPAVLLSLLAVIWLTAARAESDFTTAASRFHTAPETNNRLSAGGIVALIGLLAIKFVTLQTMLTVRVFSPDMALQLMAIHSLSRFTAISLPSPFRIPSVSGVQLFIAGLLALVPLAGLVLYSGLWIYITFLFPLIFLRLGLSRWYRRHLTAFDPVCIGATQQLAEAFLYVSFVSFLWISV